MALYSGFESYIKVKILRVYNKKDAVFAAAYL